MIQGQVSFSQLLSLIAVTAVAFATLLIGSSFLSQETGVAWGIGSWESPEANALEAFQNQDYRLLAVNITSNRKVRHLLTPAVRCWPTSVNAIDYETGLMGVFDVDHESLPERVEYAKRYNLELSKQLRELGRECKSP